MVTEFKKILGTNELDKLLLSTLPNFRSGYVEVGDKKICLPLVYTKLQKSFEELEIRNDDIIVTSFMKTGTTWTQEMVWLLANNLDYEGAKVILLERFPFLDYPLIVEKSEITKKIPFFVNVFDVLKNMKSQRFIKTHLNWELLPKDITSGKKTPKIIYIWREPRDVLVSYYHHAVLLDGFKGTFNEFFKLFIGNRVMYAPFWSHVLGFWEQRHRENMLILKYEDLKADLRSVIEKVSAFLGKKYSDEQIKQLMQHLSFENMKTNRSVNYEQVLDIMKENELRGEGKFIRSGKVGDFKNYMSQEQVHEIETWTQESLKGTGFDW